jgi:hypothetical protein
MIVTLAISGNRPGDENESPSDGVLLGNNASLISALLPVEVDLKVQIPDGSAPSLITQIISDLTASYQAKGWTVTIFQV